MSRGLNKVMLIGNLGSDPELKQVGDNQVVNVSIAMSESWKDKAGERQERTEWMRLNIWGPSAGIVAQYTRKGSRIYVEGKLQTRKWEKDGQQRESTEVNVSQVVLLDDKKDGETDNSEKAPF